MLRLYFGQSFSTPDLELYARIVERSARMVRKNFDSGFTILLWDEDTPLGRQMLARLERTGISIIKVSDIIPRSQWDEFRIPLDHHPASQANRAFAAALARHFASK